MRSGKDVGMIAASEAANGKSRFEEFNMEHDDKRSISGSEEISHVKRREVQAPIVVALIKGFAEELGYEKALGIAARIIEKDAQSDGERAGLEYGQDLKGLARVVKEIWCKDNGVVIDVLEESERAFAFNVTRCGYAEAYDKLGLRDFAACLSCNRDEPFADAFGTNIKLSRTQTIVEGASHCDFRYTQE
ncbi:MAG: L-2-amino-thiazoline-4-carboxylic acid hydrolase [Planctomycetota bacterium]